jgi:hypothetical protein
LYHRLYRSANHRDWDEIAERLDADGYHPKAVSDAIKLAYSGDVDLINDVIEGRCPLARAVEIARLRGGRP